VNTSKARCWLAATDQVEPSGADRAVQDQPGLLEHLEVLGHGWPADRQPPGQVADGRWPADQQFEDRPAGRVTERAERGNSSVSPHER
jgi:hypothetical protein